MGSAFQFHAAYQRGLRAVQTLSTHQKVSLPMWDCVAVAKKKKKKERMNPANQRLLHS